MNAIDELIAFTLVADTMSFTRAAARLGVSKSVASRRVAALEASLGARLLNRTTRGVSLTEAGSTFRERCKRILAEIDEAKEVVSGAGPQMVGSLRITAPVSFGTMHLVPALADLLARYPRLEFDIDLNDRHVDLVSEGFDLAIRIASLKDSSMIARRVAPVRRIVVCSAGYARRHGVPKTPYDLLDHECLIYANKTPAEQWRFRIGGRWESFRTGGRLRVNSVEMLRDGAAAGLGLAEMPTFVAGPLIDRGELRPLLLDYEMSEAALYLLWPPNRNLIAKTRVVVAHLSERFGPNPSWDPCFKALKAAVS